MNNNKNQRGSWEKASGWYRSIVSDKGHYFHRQVVLPGVLRLLDIKLDEKILDMGCGSGVLGMRIDKRNEYLGIDVSESLIAEAKKLDKSVRHKYIVHDATNIQKLAEGFFDKAVMVLAIQNMQKPAKALANAALNLRSGGKLVIVMNHPCFRIPRQSGWGEDEKQKIQYRKINKYMSPMEIPIDIHPGQANLIKTWDFHYPLSAYSDMFFRSGFVISQIEEWTSDKESEGKKAKMENRARNEIPLFMAIVLVKS